MVEESKESVFNEAVLKMNRLNFLQDTLNRVRLNIFKNLQMPDNSGGLGFEIMLSCLEGLSMEVSPKMTDKETEVNSGLYSNCVKTISHLFKEAGNTDNFKYFDNERFELKTALTKYETFLRNMIEVHGLSAPNIRDLTQSVIDM